MAGSHVRSGRATSRVIALVVGFALLAWPVATNVEPDDAPPPSEPSRPASAAVDPLATTSDVHEARSVAPISEPASVSTVELLAPFTVHTRTGLLSGAEIVPSVAIEIGVGTVLDPDSPVLATSETDEHGDVALTIPWTSIEAARARPEARVWVRVVETGFQRRTRNLKLPPTYGPLETTVVARPGGTVFGNLTDASGAPTTGMVFAKRITPDGSRRQEGFSEFQGPGRFAAHLDRGGFVDFLAESEDPTNGGTAALRNVDVRFTEPPMRIDLRLAGAGVLRGRVIDARGRPVAALPVCAVVAELDDESGSFVLREPRATELALEGRGRTWLSSETTADGAFEFRGLRPGLFHVRARAGTGWDYPLLLTLSPVPSEGSRELELVLDRPHIVVRLLGADGSPWNGVAEVAGNPYADPPPTWPAEVRILVGPVSDGAPRDGDFASQIPGRAVGGEYVFECAEDRRYAVGLVGGGQTWRPVDVEVLPFASRVDVALTVEAPQPAGVLLLDVHDASGAPVRSGIRFVVEDVVSGQPVLVSEKFNRLIPWRIELAPGEYRVAVEGVAASDMWHGVLQAPRAFGRFATLVRIVGESESKLDAILPVGARLRLTVHGKSTDADRSAIHKDWPAEQREALARQATIALFAEGRWPEAVFFTWELEGTSAAGTHLRPSLALETTELSQVLSAGAYRLEASLPGGRKVSAPVVLVDGETTDLELAFE